MTTRSELEALAERVEREEPSDDINELVRVAVGASRIKNSAGDMDPPAYTTSLDAAVTLYLKRPDTISSDPRKVAADALRARAQEARND